MRTKTRRKEKEKSCEEREREREKREKKERPTGVTDTQHVRGDSRPLQRIYILKGEPGRAKSRSSLPVAGE